MVRKTLKDAKFVFFASRLNFEFYFQSTKKLMEFLELHFAHCLSSVECFSLAGLEPTSKCTVMQETFLFFPVAQLVFVMPRQNKTFSISFRLFNIALVDVCLKFDCSAFPLYFAISFAINHPP